ncbi:MAG: hypothetical protein Q7T51_01175 [Candidatus Moranbacteria bacterium]|nr:hypothetical protein [Candidatus Moranbacteria bacterium]
MPLLSFQEKIKKFADIPNEECIAVLKNNLLEALEDETFLEGEMITRFVFLPYPARENLRKALNLAARSNEQMVGPASVNQWIDRYRKTYNNIERTSDTFFQFVSTDSETQKLDKINQRRLMRIFRMYDYLLSVTISGLTDTVMQILRFPIYISANPSSINTRPEKFQPTTALADLMQASLADAMKQFPELGEQVITSNRIKIMSFPEPVRPSIKNWLADYTHTLGQETHSPMVRSNYLFHSKNAQGLSSSDRENLSYILKAFDEKSVVTVDKVSKKIIFSVTSSVEEPKQDRQISNSEFRISNQAPMTNDQMTKPTLTDAPVNKISFSSPQKLAYERKDMPQDQPYRITPATQTRPQPAENRPDPRALGKNVVNLREQ